MPTQNDTIRALEPPVPWGDHTFEDDPTFHRMIDYINNLSDDNSIGQSNEDETIDPTTVPVEIAQQGHLTTMTAANNQRALQVGQVMFTDLLPEFPNSSEDGFAYVVNVSTWSDAEKKAFDQRVMYSFAQVGSTEKKSSSSFFNDSPITRTNYTCTGVVHCTHLDPNLKAMHHTEVTPTLLESIRQVRVLNGRDSQEVDANSFYLSEQQKFRDGTACMQPEPTCAARFIEESTPTFSGIPRYYIQCCNSTRRSRLHHSRPLPLRYRYQVAFLRDRFNSEVVHDRLDYCHVIEYTGTRRKKCGIDHYQGQGELIRATCGVKFIRIVPVDMSLYPYIIWVSVGTHTHPPPAINKTPKDIRQGLIDIIQRINDPSLTRNTLLKNPLTRDSCKQYNGLSLQDVHASLSNQDKIDALIYKQRVLNHPRGQEIAAVDYEFRVKHQNKDDQYIQDVFYDGENFMVICFYKQQLEVFMQQEWFQCDMAFKRLKKKDEKEIVFAMMNKTNRKTFTLIRVYVNQESTEMYYQMFQRVFALIENKFNFQVRWQHLHGEGFAALVMDMDTKQLPGFGLYLQEIDPSSRSWQWQISHAIVYCVIHFKRGVERAVLSAYGFVDKSHNSTYSQLVQLLFCQKSDDYDALCDELSNSSHYPAPIVDWARHKKIGIFRCGLNKASSNIGPKTWESIEANTNACEQTHYKSNAFGRWLPLLRAIQYGQVLDKRDCEQLSLYLNHGTQHSWRSTGHSDQMKRNPFEYARRQQILASLNEGSPLLGEDATSSGDIRQSSARGRSQVRAYRARSQRSASFMSSPTRRSSSAQSLLRASSQNLLQQARAQSQTLAIGTSNGHDAQLKHRYEEIDIVEHEESVKRLKIENEERLIKIDRERVELEKERLEIEEKKLALIERKRAAGIPY